MTRAAPANHGQQQAALGLLHLALAAPMIYLALGLPLLMRQHGWSGVEIGLFQLAGLPALLKAWMALPVERAGQPGHGARRYRRWTTALGAGYGIALLLLALAGIHAPRPLLFALLLACVLCATWADVPVSALAIRVLPPAERARAGGVRSAALFAAAILGGGLMLVLAQRLGWPSPFIAMAALLGLALACLPTLHAEEEKATPAASPLAAMPAPEFASTSPAQPEAEPTAESASESAAAKMRGFFRQAGVGRWLVLLTACFPFVGVAWVYLKPMLLDQGLHAEQVAWAVGMGGGALGAAASLAVAQGIRHERLGAWLRLCAWGNGAVLGLLALALWQRAPVAWLLAGSMALAVSVGVCSSIVFALMMNFARPGRQALDYGIQASFFALGRLTLMPVAGWMLDRTGSAGLLLALCMPALCVAALAWRWRERP